VSDGTPVGRRRLTRTHKRLLGGAASVAVVVAVFAFFLPRIADYRSVIDVLRTLSWQNWLLLVAATLLNLSTFPPPWMVALPGLTYRQSMAMTQAATALAIVSPAGAAVGMAGSYSMLRSWGFPRTAVGLAVAVTGVWNQLAKALLHQSDACGNVGEHGNPVVDVVDAEPDMSAGGGMGTGQAVDGRFIAPFLSQQLVL